MLNKWTGVRIANSFSNARDIPLAIGQQPTEQTRKYGAELPSQGNAGMAIAKAMRQRMVQQAR